MWQELAATLNELNKIEYSGSSDWGYVFVKRYLDDDWYNGKDEDAAQIKAEQERLEERLLKGYE